MVQEYIYTVVLHIGVPGGKEVGTTATAIEHISSASQRNRSRFYTIACCVERTFRLRSTSVPATSQRVQGHAHLIMLLCSTKRVLDYGAIPFWSAAVVRGEVILSYAREKAKTGHEHERAYS